MKTVLITGAAGFIGSHLCDKFLSEGYRVVGIDDLSTGNKKNLRQFYLINLISWRRISHRKTPRRKLLAN